MRAPALVLTALLGREALAESVTVTFEDIYGPCGPVDLVRGPGDPTIDGVAFDTPDSFTWNCGEEASFPPGLGNPFDTDALLLFAFGDGATITFPSPVVNLSFTAGQRTNMETFPTFDLVASGAVVATFTASLLEPTYVNVSFEAPVAHVTIAFVAGSSSLLGIDDLTFAYADAECPADLDGDEAVGARDLGILLGAWGTASHDLDGDGTVGAEDLGVLLGAWGPCA